MLIQGKSYWTKILGHPVVNKFDDTKKQWSFDLAIDQETKTKLLDAGMRKSKVRNKNDERGDFISFVRDATRKDGSPGKPFEVVDHRGEPWNPKRMIGNGSTLNVVVQLNERSYKGDKFLVPGAIKIQVWDLKEFTPAGNNDFPVDESRASLDLLEDETPASEKEW